MRVESKRFGIIEMADTDVIHFPAGIVGFPNENDFVIVGHSDFIAFLQSVRTPDLALPLVSAHVLAHDYPDVSLEWPAEQNGLGPRIEELAVTVVLSAPRGQPATVNLMAPIIVNVVTRRGAQVFLEGSKYTTRELFVLAQKPSREPEPVFKEASAG